MKPLKNITLYSRLALITSVTLVMGYVLVYAWYTIPDVNTGDTLSKDLINHMLSNITELKTSIDGKISSQWNTSGSDINYTAGKIGIGMVDPTAKLHVRENALFTNQWTDSGLSYVPTKPIVAITTDGNGTPSPVYSTNAIFKIGIGGSDTGNITTEWFRVNLNGNIGINTIGPLDKLDLNGVLRIWHDGTNRGRIYVSSNCTGDATLGIDNGRYLCFQGL